MYRYICIYFYFSEKIGLISNKEISSSSVTDLQAETFLSMPCLPESKTAIRIVESFEAHEEDLDNLVIIGAYY